MTTRKLVSGAGERRNGVCFCAVARLTIAILARNIGCIRQPAIVCDSRLQHRCHADAVDSTSREPLCLDLRRDVLGHGAGRIPVAGRHERPCTPAGPSQPLPLKVRDTSLFSCKLRIHTSRAVKRRHACQRLHQSKHPQSRAAMSLANQLLLRHSRHVSRTQSGSSAALPHNNKT